MPRNGCASLRSIGVVAVGLAALAAVALIGCGRSAPGERAEMDSAAPSMASPMPSVPMGGGVPGMAGGGPDMPADKEMATAPEVPATQAAPQAPGARHLIRTAMISVEVQDAQSALQRLEKIASSLGGFVADTSVNRAPDGSQSGNISLRVPSDRFDAALQQVREIGRVQSWATGVEDVTAAYVDLEARIKNARREEQEVTKLYDRGGKLEDVLKVSTRLAEVRGGIEQLEGQMRVMKDQVSLSTVTVRFFERGEAAVAETTKYDLGYHLRSAVRSLALISRAILTTTIYVLISGSVLWVPLLVLILVVRWRRKRAAALRNGEPGGTAPGEGMHEPGPPEG